MIETNKQKSVFMGEIRRKVHYLSWNGLICEESEKIKYENFYECELDKPPLEIDEKLYINDLDAVVIIIDKVRSADGEIMYYTDYIIKTIEDEHTQESLGRAHSEKRERDIVECTKEPKRSRKWYQFWK